MEGQRKDPSCHIDIYRGLNSKCHSHMNNLRTISYTVLQDYVTK